MTYYEESFSKCERNKTFVEVMTTSNKRKFISTHAVISIEEDEDGNPILFLKDGRQFSIKGGFIETAMIFDLATKRVLDRPRPQEERFQPKRKNQ